MSYTLLEAYKALTESTIEDIIRDYSGDYLFHWSPYKFDRFNSGKQGIHAAKNLEVCRDRNSIIKEASPGYLYVIQPARGDRKIVADFDPLYWSAKELCKIMLSKIDDTYISAVTDYTNPEDPEDHWSEEISPDAWHMEGLSIEDRPILFSILKERNPEIAFNKVSSFIKSKGYDYIEYRNYGEGPSGELSYLFLDGEDIQIIDRIDLSEVEDW